MASAYGPPLADDADFNFDLAGYTPSPPLDADFDFAVAVFSVLAGFSNIFTAIWANSDASLTNGKMYTLSWGSGIALSVLNLDNRTLFDHYTQTHGGRGGETLTNTDTRDLNVDTP
jgi:hypothetical protein